MLKRIEITNFQSHKNTCLDFKSGMNVITGSSDSGKSGILRAILLALTNKPSGDAYKSWFSSEKDEVTVSLEFDDFWFTRSRIKGKNSYTTDSGDFSALKQDVPEEISLQSNITDYNIQTQFQKYFLLQDSPGDRAKRLNELVGLEIIDTIYRQLNSKAYVTKQELKIVNSERDQILERLETLDFLDASERLLKKLDKNIQKLNKVIGDVNLLQETIESLHDIDEKSSKFKNILKLEKPIQDIQTKIDKLEKLENTYEKLQETHKELENISASIQNEKTWLKVEIDFHNLRDELNILDEKILSFKILDQTVGAIKTTEESITANHTKMQNLTKLYGDLLQKHGICPVCYSKINDKMVNTIIRKLEGE